MRKGDTSPLTLEKVEKAKALIESGMTRTEARRVCGIWYKSIFDHLGRCAPPRRPLPKPTGPVVWTPNLVKALIQDWNEGLSITEIARKRGLGRNHVVGKAHRLGLPGRPSPIKRTTEIPAND